jgi:head-tail adaptor
MIDKVRLNDLNKKIRVERPENGSWLLEKYVWGKIETGSNLLSTEHGVLENKNFYNIIIRNFINIDKYMRFIYKNTVLYIKHIDNMDRDFLKVFCEELI